MYLGRSRANHLFQYRDLLKEHVQCVLVHTGMVRERRWGKHYNFSFSDCLDENTFDNFVVQ